MKHWVLLRHHNCNKCQSLHDGTTHRALPVHTAFTDFDLILGSQICWTVFDRKLYDVLIPLGWNFGGFLSKSSRYWIYNFIFLFCTCSRKIIDMFSDLRVTLKLAFFSQTLYKHGITNVKRLKTWLGSACSHQVRWPGPCFKVTVVLGS